VIVQRDGYRFYIKLGQGVEAEIICELAGDELRVIKSFTPEEHRGKGIASTIMNEVVKYAKKNKLTIVPECSFVKYYCKKHEC